MADFVVDTFTDTDATTLASHTGETGATWTKHPSHAGTAAIQTNRVYDSGAQFASAVYYASGSPAAAEYDVTCIIRVVSTAESMAGVVGRLDTSADTFYRGLYYKENTTPTAQWQISKRVAGTTTLLGSYDQALSAGVDYTCKLEIRDAAKKLYVDGVERISSADNAITAAGKAGIRQYSDSIPSSTTGMHIDSITGSNAATTYTDTGTGILTGIGTGDASNVYVDTGSATSIFVGSGADTATLIDAGTGVLIAVGSGADAPVYADSGTGILIAVGSGADAPVYADSGTGILTGIGSGADAPVYADSGTGILTGIGSGDDANAYVDTGSATSIFVGSGVDAATLVDSGTGILIGVGSGADAPTFADTGTAIMGLFGSGSAVAVLVDTGTGIMGLFGSGFDTGGAPVIRACAVLTQEAKPHAALFMQVKPIAIIAQRPC